jgi:hypothetical protein
MAIGDIWYRVEDGLEAQGHVDECGDYRSTGSTPYARLRRFWVIRETPKGVWLVSAHKAAWSADWSMPEDVRETALRGMKSIQALWWCERPRLVRHDTRKAFARPSIEEAAESFHARKALQIAYLKAKIRNIEAAEYDANIGKFRDG